MQKVRFGKAFDCNIRIPESVLQMKLPVFALQTLVENAIKHNIFTEKRPLLIDVAFENNMLKISNNKLPKILIQKSGTGLINLNERYKLVSEKQVEIINGEKEFIVLISLLEK
jgi:LytS/YehU family sensor histidine kinase